MTSRDYFAREVEVDLQKYWLVLKRRWFIVLAVCGLTTALSVFAGKSQKPLYVAQAQILFEASDRSLIGLEGNTPRGLKALATQGDPLSTQVVIFRSIPLATQVVEALNLRDSSGQLISPGLILARLSVTPIPGTDILQVAYASEDPELAANVVNTLMDVYIQNDIQINRSAAVSAQEFINSQLPESESQVSFAESALLRFKERNNIVDLGEESRNTVAELSRLDNSLTELQSQMADSAARSGKIQQKLRLNPQEAYAVGLVSESPGVQEALVQLQTVQSELSVARTRYEEAHPEITNIRSQEAALVELLQNRIAISLGEDQTNLPVDDLQAGDLEKGLISEFLRLDTEQSGLQERASQLLTAQSSQQNRAQALPSLEKQQRELERKLNAAQTTYETLLQNLQQARVLENQNVGNARVVSDALVPTVPGNSSIVLYLLAGGFVGSLLGVAAAFLVDLVDRSVKSVREGQELYEYPLLGVIPAWQKLKSARFLDVPSVLVRASQQVPIVEAYQALQANLKFSSLDKPLKSLAITSAVAGEGKSEVVANLALTLAHLGHLVLVIDADMRNPMQHHIWDIPNGQGLSNFAVGQLSLKNAIVLKEPNLHVLPAGVMPPNPLAILESQQMASLLRACEKAYDYVIVDTPAILGRADTLTIGRMTDGVLLVMQPGMADVDSIRSTKAMLAQTQQKVLGVVANAISVRSQPDQYFYHNQETVINQNEGNLLGISRTVPEMADSNSRR